MRYDSNFWNVIFKRIIQNKKLETATEIAFSVNVGSGNGLVPAGNMTWSNADPDLCPHMASPGHNKLNHRVVLF